MYFTEILRVWVTGNLSCHDTCNLYCLSVCACGFQLICKFVGESWVFLLWPRSNPWVLLEEAPHLQELWYHCPPVGHKQSCFTVGDRVGGKCSHTENSDYSLVISHLMTSPSSSKLFGTWALASLRAWFFATAVSEVWLAQAPAWPNWTWK